MAESRVEKLFGEAFEYAKARYPLPPLKAKFCQISDLLNVSDPRVFGHTGCRKGVVCWARASEQQLSDAEILGISFHEIGHEIATQLGGLPGHNLKPKGNETPEPTQREADEIARQILRVPLYYNRRTIQEVAPGFVRGTMFQMNSTPR